MKKISFLSFFLNFFIRKKSVIIFNIKILFSPPFFIKIKTKIMNKKQRNKKEINQNKRNRMINRRYLSSIKTLWKLFSLQLKNTQEIEINNTNINHKEKAFSLLKNLYSLLDKAVKKNVIHKNTAGRKKSKISQLYAVL
jgi:small subunit ribosomal protein S20